MTTTSVEAGLLFVTVLLAAAGLLGFVARSRLRRAVDSLRAATAEAQRQRSAATTRLASILAADDTAPDSVAAPPVGAVWTTPPLP